MNNPFKKISSNFNMFLGKLTTKRFSNKENIILLLFFMGCAYAENYILVKWINNIKAQHMISEKYPSGPIVPINPRVEPEKIIAPIAPPSPEKTPKEEKKEKKPEVRDPFLPGIKQAIQNTTYSIRQFLMDYKISGILYDDKGPTAIINSKVVRIGDIIVGKTVVDIEKDKVILMENGEVFVLELQKR